MKRCFRLARISVCALAMASLRAQTLSTPYGSGDRDQVYRRMLDAIRQIKIFDNHGHPGFPDDPDVDAMAAPPGSSALRIRAENPELIAASKALFGYPYSDFAPEHTQWLIKHKAELKSQQAGVRYFDDILDKVGIATAIANRVSMPPYLDRQRFLWAFFVDSLLFPLDNSRIREQNADEKVYIPLQEKKFKRELAQAGLQSLPDSLDGYLQFVSRIVERNQANGGIAIKFEAAYFRSLYFGDPPQEAAAAVYSRYCKGGTPSMQEYTVFQDYVFRYLLREAARLHLAVHFHTSVGIGDFFSLHNGDVLNLENVLRDPRYEKVTFVLLHGGFPNERQAIWLAARKNVYLDSSLADLYLYPSEFKDVLKYWLSTYPDKVLFGSDAFPFNEALGAEEAYWLSVESSREALAAALGELVSEQALTETRALQIAHGYLHDTAAQLYRAEPARTVSSRR
jgi:uncharacterized protein